MRSVKEGARAGKRGILRTVVAANVPLRVFPIYAREGGSASLLELPCRRAAALAATRTKPDLDLRARSVK